MKKVICFVIMIMLLFCSCSPSTEDLWQEQYDLGMRYLSNGEYEEAILAFNAAIEIEAKRYEAYISLADVYIELEQYDMAIKVLEDAIGEIGEIEVLLNALTELSAKIVPDESAETIKEGIKINAISGTLDLSNITYSYLPDKTLVDMDAGEKVLASGGAERVGAAKSSFYHKNHVTGQSLRKDAVFPTHGEAISAMLTALLDGCIFSLKDISCVGFKVVHAKGVTGVQYLTEDVLQAMADFNSVAPAHNPPYIAAIRQFAALMPDTPLIGAFETAFHAQMPPEAYLYPIPLELSKQHAIRRYGFHGASLEYLSSWTSEAMGRQDLKLVCCHLGGSGSLCAVKNGISIDTTMGMGLQCGVLQNNRIGDMDPYIIFHLVEECGMTLNDVKTMLQTKSGLYGMSGGISNDLRDIEEAAVAGNTDCQNAVKAYSYHIKKYIGAYTAAMGGLDAVVFGGGIGRNSASVRALALEGLECLGVKLDMDKNANAKGGDDISASDSRVRIYVVDTNEEIIVARKAKCLLESSLEG